MFNFTKANSKDIQKEFQSFKLNKPTEMVHSRLGFDL